jgi:16S rRNA (uracil1498-N3)-methyltransferase
VFVPGANPVDPIELPKEEVDKLRKVLRLAEGDPIAVLPNDGSVIRCEFRDSKAWPKDIERPPTEPDLKVTLAQALPKADRIDTIIRMGTEIGISHFIFFGADRSVVKWDEAKRHERLRRLVVIAREAAEQSFRMIIPTVSFEKDLNAILNNHANAIVLSEVEGVQSKLTRSSDAMTIVVGPEGGWSPRELGLIGDRGVTLGPRVLRTDTAGPAAAAVLLLS